MRLLVVDDEQIVARAIRRVLAADYSVTLAYSAKEALARISAGERFDAILSDVSMPDVDGMDFFRLVAGIAPEQCEGFIFLTGHVSPMLARFLEQHGRPWLGKPFQASDLRKLTGRMAGRALPASVL